MPRPRRLRAEPLEDRSVPAGLLFDPATATLTYAAAPGAANALTVSLAGGEYRFHDPADPIAPGPSLPAGSVADDAYTVRVPAAAVGDLVVETGDGDDAVTVQSADAPVAVDAGPGANRVTLGGDPAGARGLTTGPVTVASTGGTAALTIDNRTDTAGRAVTVDAGSVTGLAAADVTYTPGEVTAATLRGGAGGNTFTVVGSPAGVALAVLAGPGDDTVAVVAAAGPVAVDGQSGANTVRVSNAGTVQGVTGAVAAGSTGGTVAVTVDDSADPTARAATLTGDTLSGLLPGSVRLGGGLATLTVWGGPGGNTFTILGTPAGVVTALHAGLGADQVNVRETAGPLEVRGVAGADRVNLGTAAPGLGGTTAGLLGRIDLASAGGTFEVSVDDSGGTAGRMVGFSATEVDGLVPGGLSMPAPTALTLRGGAGADVFAPSAPLTIPVAVFGGGGNDRFAVPAGTGGGPAASFDGQGGSDTIDYSAFTAGVTVNLGAGTGPGVQLAGVENATGGAGDDTLTGDGNANVLAGRGGSNVLSGGAGDDLYRLAPSGGGLNQITDPAGDDVVSFAGAAGGVRLHLDSGAEQAVDSAGNRVRLDGRVEHFVGSPAADDVTFAPLPVRRTVDGGGGADVARFDSLGRRYAFTPDGLAVDGFAPVVVSLPGGQGTLITPPLAEDDAFRTIAGRPLAVAAPGLLANDAFRPGVAVTAAVESGPADGTLDLLPDGSFAYNPAAGFSGTDSFTYRAGDGAYSTPARVTITVARGPLGVFAVGAGAGGRVTVYNPDGSVRAGMDAFPGSPAGVRTAAADFNGDGVVDVAAGTGPGTPARVRVVDGVTGSDLFAAGVMEGFPGGVFLAAGDLDGDGKAELVVTPDEGGGPRVLVFRGGDFARRPASSGSTTATSGAGPGRRSAT